MEEVHHFMDYLVTKADTGEQVSKSILITVKVNLIQLIPFLTMNIFCQLSVGERVQKFEDVENGVALHPYVESIQFITHYFTFENPEMIIPLLRKLPNAKVILTFLFITLVPNVS